LRRLLAAGHDLLCVDNFFTGTKTNIAHLINNPRFELMRHDITFPLYVRSTKSIILPVRLADSLPV